MPQKDSANPEITSLKGAHLYHFGLSSCSQRVRMVLDEKRIEWVSHHVDLNAMENVSNWYQSIHPQGYVPAFVHDGKLVTESIDIIRYIDATFSGGSLSGPSNGCHRQLEEWLTWADDNQWCLKHLTYELVFKKKGHFANARDVNHYIVHQNNQKLAEFMRDFSAGFSKELISRKIEEAYTYMRALDDSLSLGTYLLGETFSLADIANVVNVHRYQLCDLDCEQFPTLMRWYHLVAERPSFQRGILHWQSL